ncbi:TonB-dependent siderophore receptor [Ferrimonas balearica]|nr:TonB-dependent siderophore receptor [Ferrimonas balearica]
MAQQAAQDDDGAFRLSPIHVDGTAEADDDADNTVAREMSVGGKVATSIQDTPASVSVITEKEIEMRDADTLEEVLQYSPGIHTDYYGTDDRNDYVQIRGFAATTYRDGMTLGTMRGMREDPYAYERVEVLRGANSTLFGPADPGGSINFVSKTPKFESFGTGYLTFGSFDHKEVGVDFGNVLNEAGTLAYRVTARRQDSDLEYDHSQDDQTLLMGSIAWEPTDYTRLSLVIDHVDRDGTPNSGGYPLDREYSRDDFFGEPDFNFHEVERTSGTLMFEHEFMNGLKLNANLRYSDYDNNFGYVYLTDAAGRVGDMVDRDFFGTDSHAEEWIGNVIVQYDAAFGRFESNTLAGLEFREAETSSSSIYGDAGAIDVTDPVYTGGPGNPAPYTSDTVDYSTRALFVTQNLSFDDRIIGSVGVRRDLIEISNLYSSDDYAETSVRAALTYKLTDEVSAYASFVESVQPPAPRTPPITTGTPTLERGEQYEIGVKYAPLGSNALFSASVYDLTRENVSIPVVLSGGGINRQTVGENRVRGIDLEARMEMTDRFTLMASYSYLDSEVTEGSLNLGGGNVVSLNGNRFVQVPETIASIHGTYTLPGTGGRGDMTLGLGARYIGSYYYDARNTGKSDDALLFDASVSYEVADQTDLRLNVSNLFDEQHVVGSGTADYYNPGREVAVTLAKSW